MSNTRISRTEQMRLDVLADLIEQVSIVKDRGHDRILCVWALKLVAEDVAKLDETDRQNGYLPLRLRPGLMLNSDEAGLLSLTLREYIGRNNGEVSSNTLALLEKFNCYFEGHARYSG